MSSTTPPQRAGKNHFTHTKHTLRPPSPIVPASNFLSPLERKRKEETNFQKRRKRFPSLFFFFFFLNLKKWKRSGFEIPTMARNSTVRVSCRVERQHQQSQITPLHGSSSSSSSKSRNGDSRQNYSNGNHSVRSKAPLLLPDALLLLLPPTLTLSTSTAVSLCFLVISEEFFFQKPESSVFFLFFEF